MAHFGFFSEAEDVNAFLPGCGFRFLDVDCGCADGFRPYDFLHGWCEFFAIALHERFGYPVQKAYANGRLIHAFCVDEDGFLLDVRGGSDNLAEFWKEFRSHFFGLGEKADYAKIDIRGVSQNWLDTEGDKEPSAIVAANEIIEGGWRDGVLMNMREGVPS